MNLHMHTRARRLAAIIVYFTICLASSERVLSQSLAQLEQQAIREAIERVSPSVVQLQIIGGADRVEDVTLASGPSTGLIVSPDGYVVTSRYRFDPAPATVVALLADGRQFATEIVATDQSRKLVLLKLVNASDLPTAEIAPADSYRIGQWAIALGRTFRVDRPNVSVGIVSALDRIQGRAMQTDAAASAANYGGPVVDIEGRVLGILSPMSPASEGSIAGVEWYDSGIAFAVPLAPWLTNLDRMKSGENLELGFLGVNLAQGSPRETPPKLEAVTPAGPAEAAGLAKDDLITAINDQQVTTQMQLQYAVKPFYAGDTVKVTYQRGDETLTADVKLETVAKIREAAEAAEADKPAEDAADEEQKNESEE
ncbi:S1C family serine protease [Aeoliella sp. SH292]|uniref:S1C family serine protease n=1 Tax=Aeoliella sp. SH292 TaxID=3454464 RepID=UPI003F9814FD